MKKMIFSIGIAVVFMGVAFGVVWEEDPSFTPEQREIARQTNEQIRNKNRIREVAMNKEIAEATERFIDEIESIKAKYPPIVG